MPEDCLYEARLTSIEARLTNLEKEQERESAFRNEFYNFQRDQIEHDTRMDERMKSIDTKLDTLVHWQEEQQSKPSKRWDGLVDKILWGIIGAVLTYLLTRAGL